MSPRINHVSVNAVDLERSTAFHVELLGADPIATPNFGLPVQWPASRTTCVRGSSRSGSSTSRTRST